MLGKLPPSRMNSDNHSLTIQQPDGAPAQLFLLFHSLGADARAMQPLGDLVAREFPQAMVVSVAAPNGNDSGRGAQWFSAQGLTEENRPARIAAAMPDFVRTVLHWQRTNGVPPERTALVGFSQGAVMALAATRAEEVSQTGLLAVRVIAFAGRFASPPTAAVPGLTLHFFHGKEDAVIPYQQTITAAETLVDLGADLTADVVPHVGHEITAELSALMIERLKSHVPRHVWEAALAASEEVETTANNA